MAAKESELNVLHEVVAKVLKEQLEAEAIVTDADGDEVSIKTVSPAMVAQAIKFLKDNNITSVPERDSNIDELKKALEHKQKKGRLKLIDPTKAAGEQH